MLNAGFVEINTFTTKSGTYLSSFMAISKGSVSPSSSTITGAHILGQNINKHLSKHTEREKGQLSTCLHMSPGQCPVK